jgi:hypothetical protein
LVVQAGPTIDVSGNLGERTLPSHAENHPGYRNESPNHQEHADGSSPEDEEQIEDLEADRHEQRGGQSCSYLVETLVRTGALLGSPEEINNKFSIRH